MVYDYLNFNLNSIATILAEIFISKRNKNYLLLSNINYNSYSFLFHIEIHYFRLISIRHFNL